MSEIILFPAIYEGSRDLKDKTKKLVFQTNEITPEKAAQLQMCVQDFVYIGMKREAFRKEEINIIENVKSEYNDQGKSKSQRLRAVLYRKWEQQNEGYEVFDDYYNHHMEVIINHFKSKLI